MAHMRDSEAESEPKSGVYRVDGRNRNRVQQQTRNRNKKAKAARQKVHTDGEKVKTSQAGRNKTVRLPELSSIIEDLAGKGAGK